MRSPKRLLFAGLAAFALGLGSMVLVERRLDADDELYRQLKPLMESLSLIQNNYVDEDKVKSKELVAGAIKGMISQLDPYSQYLDEQEHKDMKQDTVGAFGGLGIEISIRAKMLTVISPIEETPADKAGLKSGDMITKINGESTDGIELMDAVHKLRGEVGTKVTISVLREGWEQARDFTLTRAVIKVRSVKSNLLPDGVGYIRLSSFMGKSSEDFQKALGELEARGARSLLIDVRNNPGGLLNAAAEIAGNFVPKGKVVVSTDGRYKAKNLKYLSEGDGRWKGPVAVLMNGGSASASEILAGALQDHGLAVLVGTKTFGKGSVQTILPLSDGSAVRLTTAKYLTPKGRALHGQGIEPDVSAEEEPAGKFFGELLEEGDFEGFLRDYLASNPGFKLEQAEPKQEVKVSDNNWQHLKPESREAKFTKDFYDWLLKKGRRFQADDFARDRLRIGGRLKEELARKAEGEDKAREVALLNDAQVKRALDVLKVAKLYSGAAKGN